MHGLLGMPVHTSTLLLLRPCCQWCHCVANTLAHMQAVHLIRRGPLVQDDVSSGHRNGKVWLKTSCMEPVGCAGNAPCACRFLVSADEGILASRVLTCSLFIAPGGDSMGSQDKSPVLGCFTGGKYIFARFGMALIVCTQTSADLEKSIEILRNQTGPAFGNIAQLVCHPKTAFATAASGKYAVTRCGPGGGGYLLAISS